MRVMFCQHSDFSPELRATAHDVIDPDLFRSALGRFASSVTILSARDASGRDHGMTVSAFASVSLDPPLVLACVDHVASIHPTLMKQDWIGISILSEGQEAASRRFADPDADRFDDLEIQRGEHDVALLGGASAHLECRIVARHEAGDHTIFVASVEHAVVHPGRPLLYYRGGYAQLER
jgi:flavin reductase (DIM6/NTAB) family NADH-FMN oxidoreductase RutF